MQAMLTELCRDNTIFPWFLVIQALSTLVYYLSVFTMILLLAHPPVIYQFLCIILTINQALARIVGPAGWAGEK